MHSGKRWLLLLLTIPVFARGQLTIQNGAFISTTGNATVTLKDIDLVINGSIVQNPGDGVWTFTGTGDNSISGANSAFFDQLRIAKTGSARIILLQNIYITGGIGFNSGLIDLNNNNILLQPGAILTGENESSHIAGSNGGYVEITTNLNAPAAVNPGNLGAIVTSSQNLGATVIRRGHYSQTNAFGGGSSILRYYDILPTNDAALNATLRINYLNSELNGLDPTSLVLWKSTDQLKWASVGYTTRDASANYVELTGISDFSRWTLSSLINPLPVRISSFAVECRNGSAHVTWSTAQEQNSSRFDVEKSADGVQWQTIGYVVAAGNSNSPESYAYTDPASSAFFYRVTEVDLDGSKTYSTTARANCGIAGDDATIYPNPVRDICRIMLNTPAASQMKIEIYNAAGGRVLTQMIAVSAGSNSLEINLKPLPPGIYFLNLQWDNGQRTKIMKAVKE